MCSPSRGCQAMIPGPSHIEIRTAVPEDARPIAAVLLEAFLEYRPSYTEGGFSATTPASDQIKHRMQEGPVWVADCGGVIVGTASAVRKGDSLYIRGMAVLPRARGSGIGKRLLSEIERAAAAGGCRHLLLSTTPFLYSAIRRRSSPFRFSLHDSFAIPASM